MTDDFWALNTDGSYSHNQRFTLRFADNLHVTDAEKNDILSRSFLRTWVEQEIAAYGHAPIHVTIDGFSTFDGSHDHAALKDIILSVQASDKDGKPTGRGGMLITRPVDLVLVAFKLAGEDVAEPKTFFLVTQSPRHGVPDHDTLGLPGGVRNAEKGFQPADYLVAFLKSRGFDTSLPPVPLAPPIGTITAAASEVIHLGLLAFTVTAAHLAGVRDGIKKRNANLGPNDKAWFLMSSAAADEIIKPPTTFDQAPRRAIDTIIWTALAAYRLYFQ